MGIFVRDYVKSILTYLTTREVFWVVIYDFVLRLDRGGRVK